MRFRALVLVTTMLSGLAFAGTTCGTATIVPSDGRIVDFDFVAPSTSNFYQFSVSPGQSYSIEVREDYDSPPSTLTTSFFSDGGTCGAAIAAASLTDTTGTEPALPANATRKSIVVPGAFGGAPVKYEIQVANGDTVNGRYVSVSVSNTTLFNSSWSTFSNFLTVWLLQNTTNQTITATLTAYDNQGSPTKAPASITFTIAPGAEAEKIIAGFAGFDINEGPQHGGYAVLVHNGPPGGVLASGEFDNPTVNPNALVPVKFEAVRQAGH